MSEIWTSEKVLAWIVLQKMVPASSAFCSKSGWFENHFQEVFKNQTRMVFSHPTIVQFSDMCLKSRQKVRI